MSKQLNKEALDIIERCRRLGFVISELSGGVLVHVPLWVDFKKILDPQADESVRVKDFRVVCRYFERINKKKFPVGHGRWHLWGTGSYHYDGRLTFDQRSGKVIPVRRKDGLPVGEKW
jgi:hypothetical protein